ncbi:hypothetical protein CCP3SC1_60067 [Gammaproteobacteria bacterium]
MTNLGRATITAMALLLVACTEQDVRETEADAHPLAVTESMATPVSGAPTWRVDDTWRYSDGYELRVSAVQGSDTTFQRVDTLDEWLVRRGLFKVRSKQGNVYREVIYRTKDPEELFPLAVNKQVVFSEEYLRAGELIRRNTSWTVEGREIIQVPAGTFNCWILVMRTRGVQSDWTGSERWWYSPEVKHYVRLEYRYGTEPAGARVLMSYNLAKP